MSNKTQTKEPGVLQCANCQSQGVRQNLCKVTGGTISVIRVEYEEFGQKRKDMTIIKAPSYSVICGRCGEETYKYNG